MQIYKDNNHKPEMALAITDFEALCGFVNLTELSQALQSVPELLSIVGQQHAAAVCASKDKPANSSSARQALKQAFTALMTADSSQVAEFVEMLDDRLRQQQQHRQLTAKEQLVMRLHQQYPHDVGVLSVFFLNLLKLKPGEAIFLPANEPHAYISGQLVECMATSDNVIRAGLTPKLRDTEVLCSSLNYHQGPPEMLHGENVQEYTQLYSPPFEEFEVYKISLPAGADTIIPANKGPTVVLVMKGSGYIEATSNISDKKLLREVQTSKGDVFFIPAQTALAQLSAGAQGLELWIAACNSKVFASQFELPNGVTNGHQVTQGGNTTDGHKLANVINIANGHKVTNGDVHVKPAVKSAVAV